MRSLHPADAVHKGFGTIPTSILRSKNGICIYGRPACRFVRSRYMAQKTEVTLSYASSVSLAFLMPSAVASITTSSFSFIEFRSTSMCFLQELVCAPPSA